MSFPYLTGCHSRETDRLISSGTSPPRLSDLDRGETEVIALAQELDADLVVIDERLGRRHARRLGLPLTGTLGVLLKAKSRGLIQEITPLLAAIRQEGIRLGDELVEKVLYLSGEQG
jgi:uncharacterized protein